MGRLREGSSGVVGRDDGTIEVISFGEERLCSVFESTFDVLKAEKMFFVILLVMIKNTSILK